MRTLISLIKRTAAARHAWHEQEQRAASATVYIARDSRGRVVGSR